MNYLYVILDIEKQVNLLPQVLLFLHSYQATSSNKTIVLSKSGRILTGVEDDSIVY